MSPSRPEPMDAAGRATRGDASPDTASPPAAAPSAQRRRALRTVAAGAAAIAGAPAIAIAQDDRSTVRLLVGAASAMDFTARLLGEYLREALGRPVVVESKLGAGGRVALGDLKRSAPDGRTLMLSTSSPFTIFPNIYTKLEYDPVVDFTPIGNVAWFDIGVSVGPQVPATDMRQFVEWARGQREAVVYGAAPGTGSASHFTGIAIAMASGLKLQPVPYKDSAQGIADAVAGRLPLMITGTSPLAQMHTSGRLRMLATSGDDRSPLTPEVPTLRQSGVAASVVINASLYGPAGMAPALVQRLHGALQGFFARADLREKLTAQGMGLNPMTPQALTAALAEERKRYAELAKASGYVPEPA